MVELTGRYFEALVVGATVDYGSIEVTEDEMLEFAERYDPQPFHVDPEAAPSRCTVNSSPAAGRRVRCRLGSP